LINAPGCNSEEEVLEACESVGEEELQVAGCRLQVFPIPYEDAVSLRFTLHSRLLSGSHFTVIDLYSISGLRIKRLMNKKKPAGTYEMDVDMSDLPAGVYFVLIKTEDEILTAKLVKYNCY
jgi:hypothetical protein